MNAGTCWCNSCQETEPCSREPFCCKRGAGGEKQKNMANKFWIGRCPCPNFMTLSLAQGRLDGALVQNILSLRTPGWQWCEFGMTLGCRLVSAIDRCMAKRKSTTIVNKNVIERVETSLLPLPATRAMSCPSGTQEGTFNNWEGALLHANLRGGTTSLSGHFATSSLPRFAIIEASTHDYVRWVGFLSL